MPREPSDVAIAVSRLSKRFGAIVAIDDLSFAVAVGSTTALLGGNGAGKTTTLSVLLGALIPSAGEVRILGVDIVRRRFDVLHRMNFSSPYVDMPRRLSVAENLTVYGLLYGIGNVRAKIAALARELHLAPLLDRPLGELSAGQKTRVAVAKAMLSDPAVLLLDEPTASLDPDTADSVRGYLEAYRARTGATILIASHNMSEVERLCDHVLMLRDGRLVDEGPPSDLIRRYGRRTMEEVFLDVARRRRPTLAAASP